MNWKRIAIFTGVMFPAIAAAAIPFGILKSFLVSQGVGSLFWLVFGQGIAVLTAAAIVFGALAVREPRHAYKHAWAVWAAFIIIMFLINVLWLGLPAVNWLGASAPLILALLIGVSLGRRWARPAS